MGQMVGRSVLFDREEVISVTGSLTAA